MGNHLLILRCRKGSAALEFAFIAPVLFLFLFGTIEIALIMYTTSILEGATTQSSRLAKTGYSVEGTSRQDMIYDMIQQSASDLFDPTHVNITTLAYSDLDEIGEPEPHDDANGNSIIEAGEYTDINGNGQWDNDMGAAGLGGANDVVVYTVTYPWKINTPLISKFFSADGIYTITSSIVVKNEPYDVINLGGGG